MRCAICWCRRSQAEVDAFHREAQPALGLARRHDMLVTGGWGVGADMFGWLYGLQELVYAIYDQPEFVRDLLQIVAEWNRQRMEVVLSAGIRSLHQARLVRKLLLLDSGGLPRIPVSHRAR